MKEQINTKLSSLILLIIPASILIITSVSSNTFIDAYSTIKFFIFDVTIVLLSFFILKKSHYLHISKLTLISIGLLSIMIVSTPQSSNMSISITYTIRFFFILIAIRNISYILQQKNINYDHIYYFIIFPAFAYLVVYFNMFHGETLSIQNFSPIGHVNYTAHAYNVWIPFLLIGLYNKNKYVVYVSFFLIIVFLELLLYSGTRGSIWGFVLSGAILMVLLFLKYRKIIIRSLAIPIIMLVLFICNSIFFSSFSYQSPNDIHKSLFFPTSTQETGKEKIPMDSVNITSDGKFSVTHAKLKSIQERKNIWLSSIELIKDNPLGVGYGNFQYIFTKYVKSGIRNVQSTDNNTIIVNSHNSIITAFAELGLAGGLLACSLFFHITAISIKNVLKGSRIDEILFISWVTTFFHSLVSAVFFTPAGLIFIVVSIAILIERAHKLGNNPTITTVAIKPVIIHIMLFFSVIFILLTTSKIVSDHYLYQGIKHKDILLLERAQRYNPWNERIYFEKANYHFNVTKNLSLALNNINHFLQLFPYNIIGLTMKADYLYFSHRFEESKKIVDLILSIKPENKKMLFLNNRINDILSQTRP